MREECIHLHVLMSNDQCCQSWRGVESERWKKGLNDQCLKSVCERRGGCKPRAMFLLSEQSLLSLT